MKLFGRIARGLIRRITSDWPFAYRSWRQRRLECICQVCYRRLWPTPYEAALGKPFSYARQYADFGGWAIEKNAVRALITALEKNGRSTPKIIEFGPGVSTLTLNAYYGDRLTMDSFEHQPVFSEKLRPRLLSPRARIHDAELWQWSDEELARILSGELGFPAMYDVGRPVPREEYRNTRIPNNFYRIDHDLQTYDALILDGANGNGRSVAFAILKDHLTDPSYILIDDVNHYNFVFDCAAFYRFNILEGEIHPQHRWLLLEAWPKESP